MENFELEAYAKKVGESETYRQFFENSQKNMVIQAAKDGETEILQKLIENSQGSITDVDG